MADENTVGSVNVELRADLTQYKADLTSAEALAKTSAASQAQAMAAAATATSGLTAIQKAQFDQLVWGNVSVAQATVSLGAESAAVKALQAYTVQLAAAERAATEAATAHATASTSAAAAMTAQAAATEVAGKAANGAHIQLSTLIREIGVIGREGARGNFNRMAGSLTILAQAAGLLSPAFIGLTAAGVGVLATIGAVEIATLKYEDAQKKLAASSVGVAGASQITAAQFEVTAEAANSASNITVQGARDAAVAFATAGVSEQSTLTELTSHVADFAALTGEKTPAAIKTLAESMADPARGAVELTNKLGFLDESELKQIQTLSDLGEKTTAQARLAKDLTTYEDAAAVAAGGLGGSFDQLGAHVSEVATFIAKVNEELHIFAMLPGVGPLLSGGGNFPGSPDLAKVLQQRTAVNEASVAGAAAADAVSPSDAKVNETTRRLAALQRGIIANRAIGNTAEVARESAAVDRLTRSLQHYIPEEEKRHRLAMLQVEEETDKTRLKGPARLRALGDVARRRSDLESADDPTLTDAQVRQRADDAALEASHRGTGGAGRGRKPRADQVAEETDKIKANTAALLAEADAYRRGDMAAVALGEAQKQAGDYVASHPKANLATMTQEFLGQDKAQQALEAAKRLDEDRKRSAERVMKEADEAVTKILEASFKPQKFMTKQGDDVAAQIAKLNDTGATYGMTNEKAAAYLETQKLLDDAIKEGIPPSQALTDWATKLGDAYGRAKAQADALTESEKGAQEAAKTLTDGIKGVLDAELFPNGKRPSLGAELKKLGRQQLEDVFNSELTGEGGYAGILGTNQSRGPGQGNKSLLGGPLGAFFGAAAHAKKPDGTASDPLHVIMAGAAAAFGGGSGIGSTALSGVKGFSIPGMSGSADGSSFGSLAGLNGFGASTMSPGSLAKIGQNFGASGGQSGGILSSIKSLFGGGGGAAAGAAGGGAASAALSIPDLIAAIPFHSGTPYAVSGPGRMVSASMFTHAPRLHSGMAPDEFPAILQHGEGVVAKNGGGAAGRKNGDVNINLAGANGDAAIRQISGAGVYRGIQEMRRANPGDQNRYHLLEG